MAVTVPPAITVPAGGSTWFDIQVDKTAIPVGHRVREPAATDDDG